MLMAHTERMERELLRWEGSRRQQKKVGVGQGSGLCWGGQGMRNSILCANSQEATKWHRNYLKRTSLSLVQRTRTFLGRTFRISAHVMICPALNRGL